MATDLLSDTDTHTEGLLWTKDRDFYLTIHSTQNRLTSMPSAGCGIRTRNPRKQAAADPHLRPRGQRHRTVCTLEVYVYTNFDRPFMVSNSTIHVSVSQYLRVCSLSEARVLRRTLVFTFASRFFLLVRRPYFCVFVYVRVRWFLFVPLYLHLLKLAPQRYTRPHLRSVCYKRTDLRA